MPLTRTWFAIATLSLSTIAFCDQPPPADTSRGDKMIAAYFREQVSRLRERNLADIQTLEQWQSRRGELRRQLFEMLGLDPLPAKTPLKPVVTGRVEHDNFTVENLHFQSRPGLYVTANLYLPKNVKQPAPAILYVCGHGRVKKDGVSLGNKTHYQHHGAWFASEGYVCLTIDTVQLGEIEGIHHGTYSKNMWWWFSRGYTPAGVEAWNCIRAVDYLQTRREVDKQRIGVTGRSGGGAYSWWVAALDDRIKAAVPVAGITDLQNHVYDGGSKRYADGCIEGHCDCMFFVNTYQWDYDTVAALVAPRPLLISNTDKDPIFPLDGVARLHKKVRRIYELHDAGDKLGLHITEGGHKDTQELRVHAFGWFNRWLKKETPLIQRVATKQFEPEQLRVFNELPEDETNTTIHDTFTAKASPVAPPNTTAAWTKQRDQWRQALNAITFAAWPKSPIALNTTKVLEATQGDITLSAYDFASQKQIDLRLYVLRRTNLQQPKLTVLNVLDAEGWTEWLAGVRSGFAEQFQGERPGKIDAAAFKQTQSMLKNNDWIMTYIAPRGIGPTAWNADNKKQTQHRRRFMMIGQTLDGMRVWDIRRAIMALRTIDTLNKTPLWLQAHGQMSGVALYASLYEPNIARLDLWHLPKSHRDGPTFLNVLRILDMPQALTMAAERSQLRVYNSGTRDDWPYVTAAAKAINLPEKNIGFRQVPSPK